ncbi:MAG: hypothetical protein N4A38_03210 [Candidatus Gracilibacteria bacterium]|nr:hypothetical protein [Candidatus Gracilibacteria bacterium]
MQATILGDNFKAEKQQIEDINNYLKEKADNLQKILDSDDFLKLAYAEVYNGATPTEAELEKFQEELKEYQQELLRDTSGDDDLFGENDSRISELGEKFAILLDNFEEIDTKYRNIKNGNHTSSLVGRVTAGVYSIAKWLKE